VGDELVKNDSSVKNTGQNTGFGLAWILLCFTLAVHVLDEALTDFLAFYNPAVESIQKQFPFLPLPTFTFPIWIALLIFAIISLSLLSPFAFGKPRRMKILAWAFGIVMLLNGILHIAVSIYLGKMVSGVFTSPLVLISSIYLLTKVRNHRNE
jgi:hypothetical protein